MHPVLIKFQLPWQEIVIGSYGLMMVFALAAGIVLSLHASRRARYNEENIIDAFLLTAAGGIAGAAVVGFIVFLPERINYGFFQYPVSLVSWGGIIGGLVTILILKKKWGLNVLHFLDAGSPGFFVAMAIGRIGCFLGGCCYGIHSESIISCYFTDPLAPASAAVQPLLPVQLISSAVLLFLGIIIYLFIRRRVVPGKVFFYSMILYSLFRFSIEFFRNDPRFFLLGFSDGQFFSVVMATVSLVCLYYINKTGRSLTRDAGHYVD